MRPHVSGTERTGFSKARRSCESGSSITTIDFSLFRLLRKASAVNVHRTEHDIPFFLTKILELTLSCISQATQYSPSVESPKDVQLVNES
jgi:hypothetical protein